MAKTEPFNSASSFKVDKQQFFKNLSQANLADVKSQASGHNYAFLATHLLSIEEEFRHLHAILSHDTFAVKEDKDYWLYCYYCCILLVHFYEDNQYNNPSKCAEYRHIANQIEHFYTKGQFPKEKLQTWKTQLKNDFEDLLSTPFHLSKIRGWLGFANIYRIAFTFSRLTAQEFYLAMSQWLSLLSRTLHLPMNLDDMNRQINGLTATFRALSVGLFMSRLLVNLSLTIKHTFFPTPGEKQLSVSARFYQEIKKRYPQMLNDIVWATINGLTNYAEFFNISAPLANSLLATFLVFDAGLLTFRLWEAEKNFSIKRSQYMQERKQLQIELSFATVKDHILQLQNKLRILDRQLEEQEIKMRALRYNFGANLAAASLIFLGFSASVFFTLPALICASYFTVVIATALYISADAYSAFKEKQFRAAKLQPGIEKQKALAETEAARKDFAVSMVKNTVMPVLIMGTLAVCWQAALLLVISCIVYEYATKYMKTDAKFKQQHLLFSDKEKQQKIEKSQPPVISSESEKEREDYNIGIIPPFNCA